MSPVPALSRPPPLLEVSGPADANGPSRDYVAGRKKGTSVNKTATHTRPTAGLNVFPVYLLFLAPTLLGSCGTDASASLSHPASSLWSEGSLADLSASSVGQDAATRESSIATLLADSEKKGQAPQLLRRGNELPILPFQQHTARAGTQDRLLAQKGRLPPLSHIHSAFPQQTSDNLYAALATTPPSSPEKSNAGNFELQLLRLGAQTRSKQVAPTKSTAHQGSVLPLRTYAYGNIHQTAYYFADVIVGTPAVQRQSLILDTGSSVVGFPCTTCRSCGTHIDPPFDCAASSTCQALKCTALCTHCDSKQKRCAYRVSYMEGSSLQGFWQEDHVRLLKPPRTVVKNGERVYDIKNQITQAQKNMQFRPSSSFLPSPLLSPPVHTNFGCHLEETALFLDQKASGIWGLEIWSQFGPPTYMTSTLLGSGISRHHATGGPVPPPSNGAATVFALCLAEHGGAFSIGEAHTELHTSAPAETHLIPDQESYSVYISAIVVGKQNISINRPKGSAGSTMLPPAFVNAPFTTLYPSSSASISRSPQTDVYFEVLLDSGTTMSYFPTDVYRRIVTAIELHAEQSNEQSPSRTRRLGAGLLDSEIDKIFVPEEKAPGKLLSLYFDDAKVDVGPAVSHGNAAPDATMGAEERRLAKLRRGEQIPTKTADDDTGSEHNAEEIIIVHNTHNLLGQLHSTGTEGIRRAVPHETENSVPQRHSNRNQRLPEAALKGLLESRATSESSLLGKDVSEDPNNMLVANRGPLPQRTETQPASYDEQRESVFNVTSSGGKQYVANNSDREGSQQLSSILVRSGHAARERRKKTLVAAAGAAINRRAPRLRSETTGFKSLGSTTHSALSGRLPRLGGVWEKLWQRRRARFVAVGEEVKDSEAEIIGDILSSHHVDEEEAYELLPQSASPRQSQAVKVESNQGELCFYLPKGRADLKYFPDIWIKFAQTSNDRGTSGPTSNQKRETSGTRADAATAGRTWSADSREESATRRASDGWLRWRPSSYLYTKGNDHYRCIAVNDDPNSQTTGVLGSSFFIGHDVIFDVGNHMVAIAEASCPRLRLKDRPRDLPL